MELERPIDYKLCAKNIEITKFNGSYSLSCYDKKSKNTYKKSLQKQVKFDDYINEECNNLKSNENEKLKEAEKAVSKQSSTKKKILNFLFLLLNIAVIVILLVTQSSSEEGLPSLKEVSKNGVNLWFLLIIIGCYILYMFVESLKYYILQRKSDPHARFILCYKTAVTGKYYDAVTPLATGGQPFQIYYLNKRGVPPASAVSIPLGKYVFNQISYIVLCLFAVIFGKYYLSNQGVSSTIVTSAAWIGLALNSLLIIFVIWLSISKKVGNKIVVWVLKLLQKMRIVKNYQKQYEKVMKLVSDYQSTMRYYANNIFMFLLNIVLNLIGYIIYYSVPFLIYCLFGSYNPSLYLEIFLKVIIIDLAISFVPLPGGAGTAELSFKALFTSLFVNGTLFYALLLWRIFSYYSFLLQGISLIIYDYFKGNKVYYWQKVRWDLQDEGREKINKLISSD